MFPDTGAIESMARLQNSLNSSVIPTLLSGLIYRPFILLNLCGGNRFNKFKLFPNNLKKLHSVDKSWWVINPDRTSYVESTAMKTGETRNELGK